jgi:hypothetical protein
MVKFSSLYEQISRLFNYQRNNLIVSSIIKSQKSTVFPIFTEPLFNPVIDFPAGEKHGNQYAPEPGTDIEAGDLFLPCDNSLNLLNAYLLSHENFEEDISKLKKILEMDQIIFEIGCGSGEVAL